MPRPHRADDVFKKLRRHDSRFEFYSGRGSHRIIYHSDINGKSASCPIPYHKGTDVGIGILRQIIRRFDLPPDIFG